MIDLQRFCAYHDHDRAYLQQPFDHMGHRYGTNGHILVRVPGDQQPVYFEQKAVAEKIEAMFARLTARTYFPLPKFHTPTPCRCCNGVGHFTQSVCQSCDGFGDDPKKPGHDCPNCTGSGMVADHLGEDLPCPHCYGHGRYHARVEIGGVGFEANYLLWIKDLPELLFGVGTPEDFAHFTFQGGEGLLMPLRLPSPTVTAGV